MKTLIQNLSLSLLTFAASTGLALASAGRTTLLELPQAKAIAARAEKFAEEKGFSVTIAIVDAGGNLLYLQRAPGTYIGSVNAAIAKARSANAFQRPTKIFEDAVAAGRTGLVTMDGLVAIEGGVPISLRGKHLGAIGVSGAKSAEDAQVAEAGLSLFTPE